MIRQLHQIRRTGLTLATLATVAMAGVLVAGTAVASTPSRPSLWPATIALPDGFQPEGIAIGQGPHAYVGSLADGSIYRANLVTGHGAVVSPGPGTQSVGLDIDAMGRLFVAGGATGDARIIDTRTGDVLASYQLGAEGSFVNDVIVTGGSAWFTDTALPVLYRLDLSPARGARLPARAETIPLTGDVVYEDGFNVNGITPTPDRRGLLVVQSNTGKLFRVDPDTGVADLVTYDAEPLLNGDGLVLRGRTLYVAQNRENVVAELRVDRAGHTARLVERHTDDRFDVPTTVDAFGKRLYLPNARFNTEPEPTTEYTVVAIPA